MIEKSLSYQVLGRAFAPLSQWFGLARFSTGPWPRILLTAFLFAIYFIPRMSLKVTGIFYSVDLRAEDFLFILLLGLAVVREGAPRTSTEPVSFYFLLFLIAVQVSIFMGLAAGTIDKPWLSALYLLKWMQYAGVYFIAWRFIRSEADCRFFTKAFFFLGLALAVYGYTEFIFRAQHSLSYYRLYERFPFYGDANHVGCFFVIWLSFFTAFYLRDTVSWRRAAILPALLFVFFPFLGCQSRKSILALAAALTIGFILSKNRRRLIPVVVLLLLAGIFLSPGHLLMRFQAEGQKSLGVAATVNSKNGADTLYAINAGFNSDAEFYTGADSDQLGLFLHTWRWMLRGTEKMILFGCGLGARHRSLYESQYVLLLSETGFLGLVLFLLLCVSPLRRLWKFQSRAGLGQAAALGWTMALAGVLVHNITCVSLSVVKVAVPFWFLTALALRFSVYSTPLPEGD